MNYKMMGRFVGLIIALEAVFMIPALLISVFRGELGAVNGFIGAMLVMLALGGLLLLLCHKASGRFGAKEGFVCVALAWTVLSILGALPFLFSREVPRFMDALFETVSGFTTTGASILTNVEGLSKGLLYWRAFTNWVGGMGVLVFLLAIVPLGSGDKGFTMHLLRAESPGPDVGKLVPKMRHTALILYVIYIVLTIANLIFLLCGGMPLLDAVCAAFSTAGTGGFGIKNDFSMFPTPYLQYVTAIFMFLFGVNFSCYYLLLLRQFRSVFKDEELRLYLGLAALSIVLIVCNTYSIYGTMEETIRHAVFQVSTIMTTSGFATTDFNLWPSFSKGILLMLMITGACAGSTAGGLKCSRVVLLFKNLRRNIRQVLNPKKVQVVRNNDRVVDEKILANTSSYLAAYVIIIVVSFLLVSLDNFSTEANISAVVSCFNNIGPGLAEIGPASNYSGYSDFSKLVLSLDMLAGRLEIFPILALFSRGTWTIR